MSAEIYLGTEEVWSFFHKNLSRMDSEEVLIAENPETEHYVYLTNDELFVKPRPLFIVYKGSEYLHDENAAWERDCAETAKNLYRKYLYPVIVESESEIEPDITEEVPDDIYEDVIVQREDELFMAANDLLETFLQCTSEELEASYGTDLADEIIALICEYLASEYEISVYRPTLVEDEDGNESLEDYPYSIKE